MDHNNVTFHLRIIAPKSTIFEDDILALSSKNTQGPFDILGHHANFVTFIEGAPIVVTKTDKTKETFTFSNAILYCTNDNVTIYTELQTMTNLI